MSTFKLEDFNLPNLVADPRQDILDKMGDLSGITVMHNLILVKMYERAPITKGGIHLAPQTQAEDIYQGVVGLVLKVGPNAFVDDDHNKFHGLKAVEGDWVVFQHGDGGRRIKINGQICKWLQDANIKAVVADPEMVL